MIKDLKKILDINILYYHDETSIFNIIGKQFENMSWEIPNYVEFKVSLDDIKEDYNIITAIINVVNQSLQGYTITCLVYDDHVCFSQRGDGIYSIFDFYYNYFDVYDDKLYRFKDTYDKLIFNRVKKLNKIREKYV